ncbi:MAG: hypothetical protein EAZ97_07850 [Bacteroidetes bacterium]|nr:MAG: hypothetical protein EAZ97_07850 [Bacteroidota bacterium]
MQPLLYFWVLYLDVLTSGSKSFFMIEEQMLFFIYSAFLEDVLEDSTEQQNNPDTDRRTVVIVAVLDGGWLLCLTCAKYEGEKGNFDIIAWKKVFKKNTKIQVDQLRVIHRNCLRKKFGILEKYCANQCLDVLKKMFTSPLSSKEVGVKTRLKGKKGCWLSLSKWYMERNQFIELRGDRINIRTFSCKRVENENKEKMNISEVIEIQLLIVKMIEISIQKIYLN